MSEHPIYDQLEKEIRQRVEMAAALCGARYVMVTEMITSDDRYLNWYVTYDDELSASGVCLSSVIKQICDGLDVREKSKARDAVMWNTHLAALRELGW